MGSKSWLDVPSGSHFSLANIPFGIISTLKSPDRHAAVAIGDHVLDLYEFAQSGGFSKLDSFAPGDVALFSQSSLNNFAARGQKYHRDIRRYLQNVLSSNTDYPEILKTNPDAQETAIFPRADVNVHLPMKIGGYTDFFVGKNHAYNCGCIFRDPKNALQPNYLHLPVAYNSRASSVVPSGTPVRRPLGQFLATPESKTPSFGPCQRLDIELELGALLCKGNPMGEPIDVNEAETYIFGFVILNDWSARDIQKWEAVPLGPFNAKTFASTISPWVILKDALEPYHTAGIHNETALHPYLQEDRKENVYDIELEVQLKPSNGKAVTLTRTNGRNLVFSFAQMLAHHTIGGCPLEVGDLIGSGTISGTDPGSVGSFLELTNGGKRELELEGGVKRKFLEDGDTIIIKGWCGKDSSSIVGFGECEGTIAPSPKFEKKVVLNGH